MKGSFERSDPDSDSSVKSPHLCNKESLPLCIGREVTCFQMDGIPESNFALDTGIPETVTNGLHSCLDDHVICSDCRL